MNPEKLRNDQKCNDIKSNISKLTTHMDFGQFIPQSRHLQLSNRILQSCASFSVEKPEKLVWVSSHIVPNTSTLIKITKNKHFWHTNAFIVDACLCPRAFLCALFAVWSGQLVTFPTWELAGLAIWRLDQGAAAWCHFAIYQLRQFFTLHLCN